MRAVAAEQHRCAGYQASGQSAGYNYNGDGTLVGQATGGVTTAYSQDLAGG